MPGGSVENRNSPNFGLFLEHAGLVVKREGDNVIILPGYKQRGATSRTLRGRPLVRLGNEQVSFCILQLFIGIKERSLRIPARGCSTVALKYDDSLRSARRRVFPNLPVFDRSCANVNKTIRTQETKPNKAPTATRNWGVSKTLGDSFMVINVEAYPCRPGGGLAEDTSCRSLI